MRVCVPHRIKAVLSLQNRTDVHEEWDLCPECAEAFQLIISGQFFETVEPEKKPTTKRRKSKED